MSILRNFTFAAAIAFATQTGVAHASVIYDLTLTATSGGTTNGIGTMTISSPPLTGINQVSNYFQAPQSGSGTLSALSITIGGDTFDLATKNNGSNPLVQFITGTLDDITYAGVAANGDSLMMTSEFVFFIVTSRVQEIGNFTATLDVASAVPEPSTWAMMILGFVGIGAMTYRRRKTASLPA